MNWGLATNRYTVGLISDISSMTGTACGGEGERDSGFFYRTRNIFTGTKEGALVFALGMYNTHCSPRVCTGCNASEDIKPSVKWVVINGSKFREPLHVVRQ